ncbi:acyl dehydratase [Endobacter medicaginis]|uniref:Acyl dehydratase n=1 Tax=Endobacter medicaginis TaxID=1181271 RepID=A0A839V2V4_9PROT|nr:MaoC/PaaZ C-terminal domain-containing protein [Endobacter medicaginis]MBB3173859.1 acyl dehydratase [Endobacter medicaginis]MCX5476141.1 MaoC/PaaZ C-terminal domain-containing protein [Endobacter medicaginis]NVN29162.1 hypothetical protein [Endobacter medicaginis]
MDGETSLLAAPVQVIRDLPTPRQIALAGLRSLRRKPGPGASLPTTRLLREKTRLDERAATKYARVCGFAPEQGVPPTWPHILAFPLHMALMMRADFPYPLIGLVHLRNRIRQHAKLSFGEALDIEVGFAGFVAHPRGQAFIVEALARRGGELVWQSTSTYLVRGVRNPAGEREQSQTPGPQPLRVLARLRLAANLGRRYAAVSGDTNPIHTSRIGARLLGFKRPIIHGMWNAARCLAAALPARPVTSLDYDTAFKLPAFLPGSEILLSTVDGDTTILDLRDRSAARPHLRGLLTFTA